MLIVGDLAGSGSFNGTAQGGTVTGVLRTGDFVGIGGGFVTVAPTRIPSSNKAPMREAEIRRRINELDARIHQLEIEKENLRNGKF